MYTYLLHHKDGSDAGQVTYSVLIKPREEILVGNGRHVRTSWPLRAHLETVDERGFPLHRRQIPHRCGLCTSCKMWRLEAHTGFGQACK